MAGQVIKRGDQKYLVRVLLGRDPDTGKRRYLNKTVHGTKKHAEQTLTALLRSKDTGTLVELVKMSLNTLLDRWLDGRLEPRVSERTHRDYARVASRYIRPALGERLLTGLKSYDIQALYAGMLERGLSPQTIRHCQNILHNGYEQAVAGRFLAAAESDPLHALFALMLGTGVRPNEAAALKWADLDPAGKTLRVQRTVQRPKGGGWTFDQTKTKRGKRTLALPDSLLAILLEHEGDAPASEHGLMFPALNGEPLEMNNVRNRNFADVQARAGLEGYNLYSLRHTHATLLLLAGVHPKVVSERLGHATVSITLDTYSHVMPNMQQEAADKLEAMLYGGKVEKVRAFN